jgi:hypothetical protein
LAKFKEYSHGGKEPASVLAASLQSATLTLHSRLRKYPRVFKPRVFGDHGALPVCHCSDVLRCGRPMPHTVIEALFGRRWAAASALLTPLAMAMPLECLAALSGPLLIAKHSGTSRGGISEQHPENKTDTGEALQLENRQ